VDIKFEYSTTKNQINYYIDFTTLSNSYLNSSLLADFTFQSIVYDYTYTYHSDSMLYSVYLKSLLNKSGVQSVSISSDLVDPRIYNLTIQAVISSSYYPDVKVTKTKTLTMQCPMAYVYVVPGLITDS
jgi:hypothetical protein